MYNKQYDILLLVEKKLHANQKYYLVSCSEGSRRIRFRNILMLFYNGIIFRITAPISETIDCKGENSSL